MSRERIQQVRMLCDSLCFSVLRALIASALLAGTTDIISALEKDSALERAVFGDGKTLLHIAAMVSAND